MLKFPCIFFTLQVNLILCDFTAYCIWTMIIKSSSVIISSFQLLWLFRSICYYYFTWITPATFSTIQNWNQNQSWVHRTHFPTLHTCHQLFFFFCSLDDCPCPLSFARAITLVVGFQHSIENDSSIQNYLVIS